MALDQNDPNSDLTYARLDATHPFIRMPRVQSLSILGDRGGMISIQNALNACKRLNKFPLQRSSAKRVFGDLGHRQCIHVSDCRCNKIVVRSWVLLLS
jgi:hypothetical protein